MALEDGLSAADAGALIKKRRKERGLTQEQLVDKTGLSSQSYLSALEKGRYHIGRSEHFGAVAQVLRLSEADIRAINPAAVITLAPEAPAPASAAFSAAAQYGHFEDEDEPIEEALAEAARLYGDTPGFGGIGDPVMQRALQGIDFKQRPQTPEEWLEKFLKYRDDLKSGHDA